MKALKRTGNKTRCARKWNHRNNKSKTRIEDSVNSLSTTNTKAEREVAEETTFREPMVFFSLDEQFIFTYMKDTYSKMMNRSLSKPLFVDDMSDVARATAVNYLVELFKSVNYTVNDSTFFRAVSVMDLSLCHTTVANIDLESRSLACFSMACKFDNCLDIDLSDLEAKYGLLNIDMIECYLITQMPSSLMKTTAADWIDWWVSILCPRVDQYYRQVFHFACSLLAKKILYSKTLLENHHLHDLAHVTIFICLEVLENVWVQAGLVENKEAYQDMIFVFEQVSATEKSLLRHDALKRLAHTIRVYLESTFTSLYQSRGLNAIGELQSFRQFLQIEISRNHHLPLLNN